MFGPIKITLMRVTTYLFPKTLTLLQLLSLWRASRKQVLIDSFEALINQRLH